MSVSLYAYSRAGTQRENVFYLQSVHLFSKGPRWPLTLLAWMHRCDLTWRCRRVFVALVVKYITKRFIMEYDPYLGKTNVVMCRIDRSRYC